MGYFKQAQIALVESGMTFEQADRTLAWQARVDAITPKHQPTPKEARMSEIKIYLKGWRDGRLYADAVNDAKHPLHVEAIAQHYRSFLPYEQGDVVYLAAEYNEEGADDQFLCERAYDRFNVGEDNIAKTYRANQNRSLSVGDVVTVDGRAYTVASVGFDRVPDFYPVNASR